MSYSNCCFLTCLQISYEAGKVVWYSHLLKNFPQFVVIYNVKGFSVVNEAEVDVFLEFCRFFYDPTDVGNLISGSSAFSKSSLYIWKFSVHFGNKNGLPWATLVVKNPSALQKTQEMWVQSLGLEDPLEDGMATYTSILAWRIPWTEEPGRRQFIGSQRVGHNWSDLAHMQGTKMKMR